LTFHPLPSHDGARDETVVVDEILLILLRFLLLSLGWRWRRRGKVSGSAVVTDFHHDRAWTSVAAHVFIDMRFGLTVDIKIILRFVIMNNIGVFIGMKTGFIVVIDVFLYGTVVVGVECQVLSVSKVERSRRFDVLGASSGAWGCRYCFCHGH
jgi:hypothetical protein